MPTAEPLRDSIIASLMSRASRNGGFVTRADLSWVSLPSGEGRRVIDAARGIWNPRDMEATLSVVSSPTGPYADREVEGGLFHYSYREGSGPRPRRPLPVNAWAADAESVRTTPAGVHG